MTLLKEDAMQDTRKNCRYCWNICCDISGNKPYNLLLLFYNFFLQWSINIRMKGNNVPNDDVIVFGFSTNGIIQKIFVVLEDMDSVPQIKSS